MGGTLRWCAPEVLGGDEQRHGWATAVDCHSWMMYCDIRDEHLPSILTFTVATGFELIAVLNRFVLCRFSARLRPFRSCREGTFLMAPPWQVAGRLLRQQTPTVS